MSVDVHLEEENNKNDIISENAYSMHSWHFYSKCEKIINYGIKELINHWFPREILYSFQFIIYIHLWDHIDKPYCINKAYKCLEDKLIICQIGPMVKGICAINSENWQKDNRGIFCRHFIVLFSFKFYFWLIVLCELVKREFIICSLFKFDCFKKYPKIHEYLYKSKNFDHYRCFKFEKV